jgi:hypothetical protein
VLSPVIDATFFLAQGYPSWRIARLEGDAITWNALPTRGLPGMCGWDGVAGRYPDLLWMRVPNDRGGLDYYRWHPSARAWSLDKAIGQGRRTGLDIGPWSSNRLLVVSMEPESVLGEPARTTWMTFPDRRPPKLPKLPRPNPSRVVSTGEQELVLAYSAPVEVAVLEAGSHAFRQFVLPAAPDAFVAQLLVRSTKAIYIVANDNVGDRAFEFDGAHWTEMELPGPGQVRRLAGMPDGALWLLDGQGGVWKRSHAGAWEAVPLPAGVSPAEALFVAGQPSRIWLQLRSDAGEGMGPLLTIGKVKEEAGQAPE